MFAVASVEWMKVGNWEVEIGVKVKMEGTVKVKMEVEGKVKMEVANFA